jgi:hypothetical protein
VKFEGMYGDGWVGRQSHAFLAGGAAGHLVLRADVLAQRDQRLEVKVDGRTVVDRAIDEGPLDLRVPIPAADKERQVELKWAGTTRIDDDDPREAAALIQFLDVTRVQAPTALRVDVLANPSIEYSGITRDGWLGRRADVVLAGGPSGVLVVRLTALEVEGQRLEVTLDGDVVFAGEVGVDVDLRIPMPAAEGNRSIGLEWTETTAVSGSDTREAAAHLGFVGLASGEAPRSLRRFPQDLQDPDTVSFGISEDGWVARDAWVTLAGGRAGRLVVRGELIDDSTQELRVAVDGNTVATETLQKSVALRIPVPAAAEARKVELHWSHAARISRGDAREAAAHLDLIGMSVGRPPTAIWRFPADLTDTEVDYTGIFPDGWVEGDASVELAGGPAAALVLRSTLLEIPRQRLEVSVNGDPVGSEELSGSRLDLRFPLPPCDTPRRIRLQWAEVAPISDADQRRAAAHLSVVAIVPTSDGPETR